MGEAGDGDGASTILVVEDNPGALKLFRLTLEAEGYRVLTAVDARSALHRLTHEPAGLAILDFRLPDMHGPDLLRALRALPHGAGLPVIAVSGFKTLLEQLHCGPEGFTAALLKPVQPSALVETVRQLLPVQRPARPAARPMQTILVVDHNHVQLKLARLRLEHEGYRVEAVADSGTALRVARVRVPDAILCDVLMPHTDGYELCSRLRNTPEVAHVPVILISAYHGGPRDDELAQRVGATALVTRTPDLAEALAVLRQKLTSKSKPPDAPSALREQEHSERILEQLKSQVRANAGFAEKSALQAAQLSILAGISEALLRSDKVGGRARRRADDLPRRMRHHEGRTVQDQRRSQARLDPLHRLFRGRGAERGRCVRLLPQAEQRISPCGRLGARMSIARRTE